MPNQRSPDKKYISIWTLRTTEKRLKKRAKQRNEKFKEYLEALLTKEVSDVPLTAEEYREIAEETRRAADRTRSSRDRLKVKDPGQA